MQNTIWLRKKKIKQLYFFKFILIFTKCIIFLLQIDRRMWKLHGDMVVIIVSENAVNFYLLQLTLNFVEI